MSAPLTLTIVDDIAEVVLNSQPVNEIGLEMLAALEEALDAIDDARPGVVLLRSDNPKGFSAGADLRALYAGLLTASDGERRRRVADFVDRIHRVMDRFDTMDAPVIGAIHGVCFGGGFELALTCDLRVADRTARFCFPELRLGLIPGFGGIPRLNRDVGNAVTRDLLLTGRSLNAKRAHEVGLVNQVVLAGEATDVARKMAKQLLRFDVGARTVCKHFVKPIPRAELAREKELFLRQFETPAVLEGLRRFVENTGPLPYLP